MRETQDPPLRLSIAGMRWMGNDFEEVGTSGTVNLYGTDCEGDAQVVLRHLRALLAKRLGLTVPALAVLFGALDFGAPNAPTETDVDELLQHARRIVGDLEALRELAPEVISDDEGSDDGDR